MPFLLNDVVPWGRNLDEYSRIFNLTESDLQKRILGCGDGPASFNAEATAQGYDVISCDPLYQFNIGAISTRIDATYDLILGQTGANRNQFVWKEFSSPEDLGRVRKNAMQAFLKDFDSGKSDGRYVTAALPDMPFKNTTFDLALCSHFLFLYSEQRNLQFHMASMLELARVAGEIRVFPLHNLANRVSPHLEPVMDELRKHGHQSEIVPVEYEFQKGGNKMLRVTTR
ncbi:MAG TPA: hypothetical protein VJZ27_04205 [Aggregatilineales bacterium]|nr:hypothetical protein [Aggregatilineales bacterium]